MVIAMTDQKIDFVISWVDGNDTAWQKEKNSYLHPDKKDIDASTKRFRDWENLKYWFRAVEKYAPWVNRVHFLTWGHLPDWMNPECSKLHIVNHKDYIPEEYLPVFSSHPIELNIHRIEGLADQLVYFNDDMFLNAPVKPEDFFVKGLPCDTLEEQPLVFYGRTIMNNIKINDLLFASTHFNRKECRKQNRGKWYPINSMYTSMKNFRSGLLRESNFLGFYIHHLPQPYRKSTLEQVWEADYDTLHTTCSHRFRSMDDVSQGVFRYWHLLKGEFQPIDIHKHGRFYETASAEEICQAIRSQKYKTICINDSDLDAFEEKKRKVNSTLESMLPEKSQFEK